VTLTKRAVNTTNSEFDFTYKFDGLFYYLYPNNNQAVAIWNQIEQAFENCVIPFQAWPSVKAQIKAAGYSVRQRNPRAVASALTDAELLKALME
jgi:hypothetical protein